MLHADVALASILLLALAATALAEEGNPAADLVVTNGRVWTVDPARPVDDGRWAEGRSGSRRAKTTYAFRSFLDARVRPARRTPSSRRRTRAGSSRASWPTS